MTDKIHSGNVTWDQTFFFFIELFRILLRISGDSLNLTARIHAAGERKLFILYKLCRPFPYPWLAVTLQKYVTCLIDSCYDCCLCLCMCGCELWAMQSYVYEAYLINNESLSLCVYVYVCLRYVYVCWFLFVAPVCRPYSSCNPIKWFSTEPMVNNTGSRQYTRRSITTNGMPFGYKWKQ